MVTRTGIETTPSHFAIYFYLRKIALQCGLQEFAQNANLIIYRIFL